MRRTASFLAIILVVLTPSAGASGLFEEVSHAPQEPRRGDPVTVMVRPAEDADIAAMRLTHCRVEPNYACSIETAALADRGDGVWTAVIPWQPRFFDGTTWVGYNLLVTFANGTERKMPAENVPETPPGLPLDADHYYFYRLGAAHEAPSVGMLASVTVLAFLVGGMRRRVHTT